MQDHVGKRGAYIKSGVHDKKTIQSVEKTEEKNTEWKPMAFRPDTIHAHAPNIATLLKDIIKKQGLSSQISGREYVNVEGWLTLGSLMGVFADVVDVRRSAREEAGEIKYEAEVRLVTMEGVEISRARAICSNREGGKQSRDEYVIHSMAQTRATGRAFRQAFGWIMQMAGYAPTPQEEMVNIKP